eukprot:jgi/Ulvmu1/2801/UM141_0009.1
MTWPAPRAAHPSPTPATSIPRAATPLSPSASARTRGGGAGLGHSETMRLWGVRTGTIHHTLWGYCNGVIVGRPHWYHLLLRADAKLRFLGAHRIAPCGEQCLIFDQRLTGIKRCWHGFCVRAVSCVLCLPPVLQACNIVLQRRGTCGWRRAGRWRMAAHIFERLEVFSNGGWGTVCSRLDHFSFNLRSDPAAFTAASVGVACRQLGFASGTQIQSQEVSDPGEPKKKTSHASRSRWPARDASAARPGCWSAPGGCPSCSRTSRSWSANTSTMSPSSAPQAEAQWTGSCGCRGGKMAAEYMYGRLEVFLRGFWRNVCPTERFTPASAHVACRQLGYDGGAGFLFLRPFEEPHSSVEPNMVPHQPNTVPHQPNMTAALKEGDLRLLEQVTIENWITGELQVFFEGSWSQWRMSTADSARLTDTLRPRSHDLAADFATSAGADGIDAVDAEVAVTNSGCRGCEARLLDCPVFRNVLRRGVSRVCKSTSSLPLCLACVADALPGEEGALRLRALRAACSGALRLRALDGGPVLPIVADSGFPEVFHAGAWGTFCPSLSFKPAGDPEYQNPFQPDP